MDVYSVSGSKRGFYQSCSCFQRKLKWPTTTDNNFYPIIVINYCVI